ncbi:hypothetical protein [Lactiplantibacillus plantarum]|uniref:hypothetical protein n=1 Tax=Lactiplantibacillus plantarum TaxID=1590 RepID=UPI002652703D|nr:hypothetical protein [Lactiplantibacillus plantarum]MDN7038537.1 hypothetical protein [Lactiplantibacillus plantarum]
MAQEAKVAVFPSSAFFDTSDNYLRFSFASSMETIVKACDRLEDYFNQNYVLEEGIMNGNRAQI